MQKGRICKVSCMAIQIHHLLIKKNQECWNYLSGPWENDGNESKILAAILDEFIL